jgi:hypothetical protein
MKVLKTGTLQTLKESFGDIGGIVTPAIRFLLAACKDTGVEVSPHILKNRIPPAPSRRRKSNGESGSMNGDIEQRRATQEPQAGYDSMAMALLNKFPEFDPAWPEDQQKAWFSAYEKLLQLGAKKKEIAP